MAETRSVLSGMRGFLLPGRASLGAMVAALIFTCGTLPGAADDLQGADSLLKQLDALQSAAPAKTPASSGSGVITFAKDLAAFTKASNDIAPPDAAQQWMALYDRAQGLNRAPSHGFSGFSGAATLAVFTALPSPAAWPSLQKLVEGRAVDQWGKPAAGPAMRLIMDTLNNKEDQQWTELAGLMGQSPSASPYARIYQNEGQGVMGLGTELCEVSSKSDDVEKFWKTALGDPAAPDKAPANQNGSPLVLPDLVTILGAARAEPLIRQVLLLPEVGISGVHGLATEALARKLALANIDKVRVPPWCLTQSLDGAPLYEALTKKFPNNSDGQACAIYYVIALVVQGKPDEAAKASAGIDFSNIEAAAGKATDAGYGLQVYDFIHSYLTLHPESDIWKFYVDLAGQTGHAAEALKFIQDTSARTDISDVAHGQVRAILYRALLAVDKVDEGIEQLRALIKSQKGQLPVPPAANSAQASGLGSVISQIAHQIKVASSGGGEKNPTDQLVEYDIELAKLGRLLKRDDLEKEGLTDAMNTVRNLPQLQPGDSGFSGFSGPTNDLVTYLIETGRYAEAEKLLIGEIVRSVSQSDAQAKAQGSVSFGGRRFRYFDYETRQYLMKLALVYYEAGRWADIMVLLGKVPDWGVKDLAEIANEGAYLPHRTTPHMDLMAARALAETGQVEKARPILDYTLQEDSDNDAAYALLLKIGTGDVVAKLDALYKLDQFQERPLIWKAVLLLKEGKVDEAESACKAAIAVDPSDGEEGKGDRMRVYSVMADVCEAKKDDKQAAFFRNVVKAIRLSEDADDFYDAGLLTRAVAMYNQALGLFADAYCIQSRMARQLAELGRLDEAAVHYRKAFELMPVSFGRLESHCFGCERAFEGKTATSIAEKVFTEMMAKDPKKPQIPYLLGYLYMEEKHYPEALANFQKAAQLDPDYINAWKHIVDIGKNYQLNPDLRDEAVFNLLRLDPAGRHVTPDTSRVRQLDKLWVAEEKAAKAVPVLPKALLVLTASAAQISGGDGDDDANLAAGGITGQVQHEAQAWIDLQQKSMRIGQPFYHSRGETFSPRDVILSNQIISGAIRFF